MAYIGKEPIVGNFQKCDAITVVNGQAAYTLQVGSANVSPESVNHMIVSLNGVIQAPTTAYTVSGATLTFDSNLATGDVIDFVLLLGNVLDIGTPSDGTVTNAKLSSDLISGETDIGGAIADADLFLMDDGAGGTLRKTAASRIKTYVGGGLSVADQWRLTANFVGTNADISANLEQIDTTAGGQDSLGSAMTQSSGVFTFPSTGYWLVMCTGNFNVYQADNCSINTFVTIDNSSYVQVSHCGSTNKGSAGSSGDTKTSHTLVDVTSTSNVKVKFTTSSFHSSSQLNGDTAINYTHFTFLRLGDT